MRAPTREAPTQATWRARRHVDGFFSRTFGRVIRYRELAIQKKGRPLPATPENLLVRPGT